MNEAKQNSRRPSRWNRLLKFMTALEEGATERQDKEVELLKRRVEILELRINQL